MRQMSNYYGGFTDSFMGRGLDFSIFDEGTKSSKVAYGEDKIHNSIHMILSTRMGERVFLPDFGSNLHKILFEPNDLIAEDLARIYIEDALSRWERRIIVNAIEMGVPSGDNVMPIAIYYTLRNTNIEGLYVYPFNIGSDGREQIYDLEASTFE